MKFKEGDVIKNNEGELFRITIIESNYIYCYEGESLLNPNTKIYFSDSVDYKKLSNDEIMVEML